LAKYNVGKTVS